MIVFESCEVRWKFEGVSMEVSWSFWEKMMVDDGEASLGQARVCTAKAKSSKV